MIINILPISEELDKEENEDRKAEIIHQLNDELNELDVEINIVLCDSCQKKNILNPLYELLTKLNESNESIISNKLLDTLKIDLEELEKEENEDRGAEMIHKLSDELNELDFLLLKEEDLCYIGLSLVHRNVPMTLIGFGFGTPIIPNTSRNSLARTWEASPSSKLYE
ncbi:15879_t:CDS:2 [Entrophospora sp. SA101]|nr:15879_t:CDS:2 [Entrophospora sp. SA101]